MISFISIYYQRVLNMLLEHFLLVFLSVLISFLLAIGISALIRKRKKITAAVLILFIAIYCIPSLALFSWQGNGCDCINSLQPGIPDPQYPVRF